MKQYTVCGMSCAACSARVEKAVSAVDGVVSCTVNLLTNSMTVEGSVDSSVVIAAVERAGYAADERSPHTATSVSQEKFLQDTQTPKVVRRLIASLCFLIPLMLVSMAGMLGLPLIAVLADDPLVSGLVQLVLSAAVMILNRQFFVSGIKGALRGAPNMDTLVSLGSAAAFGYSTVLLLWMIITDTHHGTAHYYFESAAMILTLITVGKLLEARSKGKTTDAIKGLMDLAPKTAVVIRNGVEQIVPADTVAVGDRFVVKAGDRIPVDGKVIEGAAAVDQSALTGESVPVDKSVGDTVSAATVNRSGYLLCEATRVGEDTTLQSIIRMVSDAAASKAPIAKIADTVSGIFVPVVLIIALATAFVWLLSGESVGFALARAISVLVISCPCALGLATPVAIMVGSGVGAKHGILFKTATALEQTGRVKTVALDKTGTLTKGEPRVTAVFPAKDISENTLLQAAVTLEAKSEHPLARAVMTYGGENGIIASTVTDYQTLPGNGVTAVQGKHILIGGHARYVQTYAALPDDLLKQAQKLSESGETPLWFVRDDRVLGMIAVADVLKEDSVTAVAQLKSLGLRVVMLTGDNARTARAVADRAGVDDVIAEVLPDGKEAAVRSLRADGSVMMVGDGINDAPALTSADIGVAIGAGADIAVDAADVVLMNTSLSDVSVAIRLSRAVLRNIRENLFWAFFYNVIGIPLAAGVWIPLFGWELDPMFGAAAMSLSSFCVVTNALRLNFKHFRTNDTEVSQHKEETIMTITMHIEGMMCPHCSGRVKTTLESIDGVTVAEVSHESGTAVVTLAEDLSVETLKSAVEAQGYAVTSMQ